MRKGLNTTIFVFFLICTNGFGQQEQLYTMFMYNKMAINPAFAGNHAQVAFTGLVRNQWIGFEGAPNTQSISLNAPLASQKIGLGINLIRNTIGISKKQTVDIVYSYRINIGDFGNLSLGLQGSSRNYQIDFTDPRLNGVVDKINDPAIQVDRFNKSFFNFGAGIYYNSNKFYAGLSSLRFIERNISFAQEIGFAEEVRHINLMIGGEFSLDDDWKMTPQTIMRFTANSPFDIDINASWTWRSLLTGGITYRLGGDSTSIGESLDIIFGIQASKNLMLSLAYDFTLSQIRTNSSGSFEMGVHYQIGKKSKSVDNINPRYF